jgi:type I restriction enzyme S subunit
MKRVQLSESEQQRFMLQVGDLLFARRSLVAEGAGKCSIVCKIDEPTTFESSIIRARPNPKIADSFYLYYLFRSPYGSYILDSILRHVAVAGITGTDLVKLQIPLPPLPEQKAIAHILGTLDDKIELNQQMNQTLEAIARAIFKSWFVNFDPVRAKMEGRQPPGMDAATADLFPDEFEDSPLGKIPKGWRVSSIGESVRVVGGSTPSTKQPAYWNGGTIYWATPKDLASLSSPVLLDTERRITELGLKQISSGLLPKGTVLLSSRAPIGYLAIPEITVAINQGFIAMVCERELPNHYILHWTRENMDIIVGRANGTTFLEISKANFRPIPVVIPTQDVLQQFTNQIELIHQQIVNNFRQSRTLATIRDTLLPKLLSGEIRVRDAEKIIEVVT